MRVLFVTGEFPPMQGGVGDCTNETASALLGLGVEVQVLTSTRAAAMPASGAPAPDLPFVVHPLIENWNWFSFRTVAHVTRAFSPAVVHVQYQTGAYGMHPAVNFLPRYFRPRSGDLGLAPRRGLTAGLSVVTTFHDLRAPYLFPKAGRIREWVTNELARTSDAVVATNDQDYEQLQRLGLSRLALIPIGSNISTIPPPDFDRQAWRARLGVGPAETLLCYFGFLNESKGGETLIRALAQLPESKLLMIGGRVGASDPTNAAYLARVEALISEFRIEQRVLWTDHTPPEIVSANFLASDLCVLPYRDGASYRRGTLMAALAHGMAIVSTMPRGLERARSSPLPQLRDGENCLFVPPDDPDSLAMAVRRAAASPELRAKIGGGARELARRFTWDRIARQHLDLYRQLTNEA